MREDTDLQIIENVKKLRKKLNISQRTLAEIIGTSYSFVGQVERKSCVAKYSAHHLFLIAKYFGCQVSDLYPPIDTPFARVSVANVCLAVWVVNCLLIPHRSATSFR